MVRALRTLEREDGRPIIGDAIDFLRDMRDRIGFSVHHLLRCERCIVGFVSFSDAKTASDIRPREVLRWLNARSSVGIGRKTQLNDLGALRSFADWLVSIERIDSNPLRGLRTPRIAYTRGCEPFTIEEVRRIIAAAMDCERSTDRRYSRRGPMRSTFYAFIARTGMRRDEAGRQKWSNIDLSARAMVVEGKHGRVDVLPLDGETVRILSEWRRWSTGELVFPESPSHHSLAADCERAGIEHKPGEWHRFRKMSITERGRLGASIRVMQMIARHNDPKTTQKHYDFVAMDEMRSAMGLLPTVLPNPIVDFSTICNAGEIPS